MKVSNLNVAFGMDENPLAHRNKSSYCPAETRSFWPVRTGWLRERPFNLRSSSTVIPYFLLILDRVSPFCTVWYRFGVVFGGAGFAFDSVVSCAFFPSSSTFWDKTSTRWTRDGSGSPVTDFPCRSAICFSRPVIFSSKDAIFDCNVASPLAGHLVMK